MLYSKYNTHVWFLKDSFYWVIQAYFFHCFISKEFWNLAQAFVASTEITFPLYSVKGSPDSSVGKESTCNAGDPRSIPGLGRSARGGIGYPLQSSGASLLAQLVKNPPAKWETWVPSLGWEDPLEKRKTTHSSSLAWRIPRTVYSPWGHEELDTTEQLSLSLYAQLNCHLVRL